ncbi:MAG: winged helix-turn-helix transcriptional regulator [Candidatus Bathyarchaeota archaeon]
MPNSEEEPYSLMFSSLSHPARRKILRMLSEKPRNFSTILEALGISSSHLTYHLENLGELVTKMDDGRYKLSTFGDAAVMTMRGVEESPDTKPKHLLTIPLRWKSFFAVLMIWVIILAAVSCTQYMSLNQLSLDYQQISEDYELLEAEFEQLSAENEQLLSWGTPPSKVFTFLRDVVHLDLTKYAATQEGNTVEYRSDLGGIVEEIMKYSLTNASSKVDVTLRFRNASLSRYSLQVLEGTPYYSQLQPTKLIDAAKGILERYHEYSRNSHLQAMRNMLETVNETGDFETTSGNMKLIRASGRTTIKIEFVYTTHNIDFQAKSVVLIFDNYGFLLSLSDNWSLFRVGSTEVNISKEEAINIAMEYAKNCTWTVNGETISNFTLVTGSATAELWPHSREDPLALIPYWYVTIPLDRIYPERVDRIAVGLWADTGEFSICQPLSW